MPDAYGQSLKVLLSQPAASESESHVPDYEEEAIKVTEKKNLENDIENETLEIDEIVNIKESRNHPLENEQELIEQRFAAIVGYRRRCVGDVEVVCDDGVVAASLSSKGMMWSFYHQAKELDMLVIFYGSKKVSHHGAWFQE
ncbi:hypothetical protein Tco_0763674 [Tanacetum coccineum]